MLSELEQKAVWEHWLGAEIRANYFADLSYRYQRHQRALTWFTLATSSGAFVTLVTDVLPPSVAAWLRPVLTLVPAALSLWMLVAQNYQQATACSDLHFRWHTLADDFERLWGHMHDDAADRTLQRLTRRVAEASRSGVPLPNNPKLMEKWQDHVERHHAAA